MTTRAGAGGNDRDSLVADGLDTVAFAAEFLKLSRAKVYQLMDSQALAYCKIGRSRRIPRRALLRYAEKCLAAC